MLKKADSKKGQIWVETVIYTLIGLSLIAVVLAFAIPEINKQKDKLSIDRAIESMTALENNINSVSISGPSSTRTNSLAIGNGELTIDGEHDKIFFEIDDSSYAKSEYGPGGFEMDVSGTSLKVKTEKTGNKFKVTITLNYEGKKDIQFNKKNETKILTSAPVPYTLMVENNGNNIINFYLS